MANGDESKKFDLELGTKADTSGLEATERALRSVEEAGKDASGAVNPMTDGSQGRATKKPDEIREVAVAIGEQAEKTGELSEAEEFLLEQQRKTDVERAKALKAGREQAAVMDEIAAGTRRLVAIQLAGHLNQIAQEFRGVSKETDAVLDVVNAMTAGLMSGNPYVALGAAALSAGKMIHGAYQEAAAADAYYAKAVVDGQRMIEAALDAKRIRGRKNFVTESFEEANAEMVLAMENLERLGRMMEAQAAADSSDREADQRAALRSGADPAAVERADIAGDFAADLAELRAGVQAANDKAELLKADADRLQGEADRAAAEDGFNQVEMEAAQKAADEAKVAAAKATEEAKAAGFIATQKSAELFNTYTQRVNEGFDGLREGAFARAQAMVAKIETSGAELDTAQQAALERTKKALSDGTFTANEQAQYATDLQGTLNNIRGTLELQQELQEEFAEITTGQQQNTSALLSLARDLKADVAALRAQISTAQSAR